MANEYYMAKRELKDLGFRTEGIFDLQLLTFTSVKRNEWEEDQTMKFLKKKGAFYSLNLYNLK